MSCDFKVIFKALQNQMKKNNFQKILQQRINTKNDYNSRKQERKKCDGNT